MLATLAVTSLADAGPGSLRAAIEAANNDPVRDTIVFDPAVTGTITLSSALPELSTAIHIAGPGAATLTVARGAAGGTPEFRIFTVPAASEVLVSGLTITGGRAGTGGGIENSGTMTLVASTLSGNTAGIIGGGVFNSGTLTISASTLSGNSATGVGEVVGSGGGISNVGTLTVAASTLNGNAAAIAGGIRNSGTLTISASTLSGNMATGGGAGITNGGAIVTQGKLSITSSTLSGNRAADGVGGISGDVTLASSILSNTGSNLAGLFVSLGHNLFSDSPSVPLDPSDLTDTNPLLGPLADNGGPTLTHALLTGSSAINNGVGIEGQSADQRGVFRPQGDGPDIGAFELDRAERPFPQLLAPSGPALVGTARTVTATVLNTDLRRLTGVPVTFRVTAGPNVGVTGTSIPADGRTDAGGQVRFSYVGSGGVGTDMVVATATLPDGSQAVSPPAAVEWGSFTVTTTDDAGPGSLRTAIRLANLDPAPDTITFDRAVVGTIALLSTLPDLSDLSIVGPGASVLTVARSATSGAFRIFTVPSDAVVAISGLTVSGGQGFPAQGGGIFNQGVLTIDASTISGNNTAAEGGGIFNQGALTINASTLSGNSAGIAGGGIFNFSGSVTITNSTLSGNSAGSFGGGIFSQGTGSLTVAASTLSGNLVVGLIGSDIRGPAGIAGSVTLTASILSNSGGNIGGALTSLGHNLFSDAPNSPLDPSDLINTDPILGPLADNDGPTFTHALLPGSPAIDAGAPAAGVATDQRGIPRPQGAAPDIGAFESRGFTLTIAGGVAQAATAGSPFASPPTVAVVSPFGEPVVGGRVTFSAPQVGPSASFAANPVPIGEDGRAVAPAVANGAGGAYAIIARAAGAKTVAFSLSNVAVPPRVVALRLSGDRRRRTRLVLSFDAAMDPARTADRANFHLGDPGRDRRLGTRDDRAVKIRSAAYDPASRTVILTPAGRPDLRRLLLTARGTAPGGLTDVSGNLLDGDGDGRPGGDYTAVVMGTGAAGRKDRRSASSPALTSLGTSHRGTAPAARARSEARIGRRGGGD